MGGFDGIGKALGKIADQFQGRVERLKNEKAKKQAELDTLLAQKCTDETAKKASKLMERIREIDAILVNKASD